MEHSHGGLEDYFPLEKWVICRVWKMIVLSKWVMAVGSSRSSSRVICRVFNMEDHLPAGSSGSTQGETKWCARGELGWWEELPSLKLQIFCYTTWKGSMASFATHSHESLGLSWPPYKKYSIFWEWKNRHLLITVV